MAAKIKKGDTVRVIAGAEKDKEGKVLEVKDGAVKVEGINMVTKHMKQNPGNPNGGIVTKEAFIDASNVMLVVGKDAVRVGFKVENGLKYRINKKNGEVSDIVSTAKKN